MKWDSLFVCLEYFSGSVVAGNRTIYRETQSKWISERWRHRDRSNNNFALLHLYEYPPAGLCVRFLSNSAYHSHEEDVIKNSEAAAGQGKSARGRHQEALIVNGCQTGGLRSCGECCLHTNSPPLPPVVNNVHNHYILTFSSSSSSINR